MWKLSFCRSACTEASAGRFPPAVRPAAQRGGDRHSAGPPVGHVCREAQRYEGGRHRRAQGAAIFFDHCSLSMTHEHTISFYLVRKLKLQELVLNLCAVFQRPSYTTTTWGRTVEIPGSTGRNPVGAPESLRWFPWWKRGEWKVVCSYFGEGYKENHLLWENDSCRS